MEGMCVQTASISGIICAISALLYLRIFVGLCVCGVYLYESYMSARKHCYSTLFSASIMSIFASARLESSATSQAKKRVKAQANT